MNEDTDNNILIDPLSSNLPILNLNEDRTSSPNQFKISSENGYRIENFYNFEKFSSNNRSNPSLKNRFQSFFNRNKEHKEDKSGIKKNELFLFYLRKHLPILTWLPNYSLKNYLVSDLISGLTVGIMNTPQSLAYAMLATLNPVYGLYMALFPLLIYGILGTSKHLAIGAVAIVSMLTGSVVDRVVREHPLAPTIINMTSLDSNSTNMIDILTEENYRVMIASTLALMVGIFQFGMGLSGVGFLSSYFSDTFISGYTCASSLHVVVSQTKEIFGMRNVTKFDGSFKVPKSVVELFKKLPTSNWYCLAFSTGCILFLVACKEILNPKIKKKLKIEFPSELLLIILMTLISYFFDISEKLEISVLKTIPTGLPSPQLSDLSLTRYLLKDMFLVGLISFSISISLASLFARRKNYKIDPTQELYALGLSNVFGSMFSCFPSTGSLSRSSLLETTGAKSQFASVFSSTIIIVVILWVGPLFKTLPKLCLASIIVVSLKSLLFQLTDFFDLMRINRIEALTWLVTFFSVVIFDVDLGLFIGLGFSICSVLLREQFFSIGHIKKLVRYKNHRNFFVTDEDYIKLLEDSNKEDSNEISFSLTNSDEVVNEALNQKLNNSNVKLYRIEQSIYFSNCEFFHENFYKKYAYLTHNEHLVLIEKFSKNHHLNTPESEMRNEAVIKHSNLLKSLPDVIMDFSAVNYIDTNGVKILANLIDDFRKIDVFICICQPQENFIKILYNMKMIQKFDGHVFVTVNHALIKIHERYCQKISVNQR